MKLAMQRRWRWDWVSGDVLDLPCGGPGTGVKLNTDSGGWGCGEVTASRAL